MASYNIVWKRTAQKELRKLPKEAIAKIVGLVENLAENPYPSGTRKLAGTEHTYRLKTGNYRVIYNVSKSILIIEIIRIGHRKEIYRKLP